MCQKCGRNSGLWVLHEIVNITYAENMKTIVCAVWDLPAAQPIQPIYIQIGLNWLCYLAGNSQMVSTIFFMFSACVLLTIS